MAMVTPFLVIEAVAASNSAAFAAPLETGLAVLVAQPSHGLTQSLQNESPQPPQVSWHSSQSELSQRGTYYRSSRLTNVSQSAQHSANQSASETKGLSALYECSKLDTSRKKSSSRPSASARRIGSRPSPSQSSSSRTWGWVTSSRTAAGRGSRATTRYVSGPAPGSDPNGAGWQTVLNRCPQARPVRWSPTGFD